SCLRSSASTESSTTAQPRGKHPHQNQGIKNGAWGKPGLMPNRSRCGLHLTHVSDEPVTPFRQGLDVLCGFPVIAKQLPQSEDVLRQRGLLDECIRPDLGQEL